MNDLTSIVGTFIGTVFFILSKLLFQKDKDIGGYILAVIGLVIINFIWSESFNLNNANGFAHLLFYFGIIAYMTAVQLLIAFLTKKFSKD